MTDIHGLTGVLRWERPPSTNNTGGTPYRRAWAVVAADLRNNPGEWGIVLENGGTNGGSVVARINNGQTQWFLPAGAFLAVQRTLPGNNVTVFAVYLGENHEYAEKAGVTSLRAA